MTLFHIFEKYYKDVNYQFIAECCLKEHHNEQLLSYCLSKHCLSKHCLSKHCLSKITNFHPSSKYITPFSINILTHKCPYLQYKKTKQIETIMSNDSSSVEFIEKLIDYKIIKLNKFIIYNILSKTNNYELIDKLMIICRNSCRLTRRFLNNITKRRSDPYMIEYIRTSYWKVIKEDL